MITVIATTIDLRLDNWGRAWRSSVVRTSVYSAETHWRNRTAWHWDYHPQFGTPPRETLMACDRIDALDVERAVCTLDTFHHIVLAGHFVRQWEPQKTLRLARSCSGMSRIRFNGRNYAEGFYSAALQVARELADQALAQPLVVRRDRAVARAKAALGIEGVLQLTD